jgi:hypothetical protein
MGPIALSFKRFLTIIALIIHMSIHLIRSYYLDRVFLLYSSEVGIVTAVRIIDTLNLYL